MSKNASNRADAAAYIADLAHSLALMARRNGFETLGYILDMAKMEAEQQVQPEGRDR